ncbi:hypothetical protein D3C73_1394750 [compost metagenome]
MAVSVVPTSCGSLVTWFHESEVSDGYDTSSDSVFKYNIVMDITVELWEAPPRSFSFFCIRFGS